MKSSEVATHGRRAVIELREKIINGELPGGMRLFEVPLAETVQHVLGRRTGQGG